MGAEAPQAVALGGNQSPEDLSLDHNRGKKSLLSPLFILRAICPEWSQMFGWRSENKRTVGETGWRPARRQNFPRTSGRRGGHPSQMCGGRNSAWPLPQCPGQRHSKPSSRAGRQVPSEMKQWGNLFLHLGSVKSELQPPGSPSEPQFLISEKGAKPLILWAVVRDTGHSRFWGGGSGPSSALLSPPCSVLPVPERPRKL